MPMASISRWTMSYFAVALAFLLTAEAMMAAGIGYPFTDLADPVTLILVHLVTIGWLSLAMAGALIQFLPVLLVQPLAAPRLALPVLALIVTGLGGLCAGFLAASGLIALPAELLPAGGVLLLAGFALLVFMLGRTLAGARPLAQAPRFVAVGLACLLATASSGTLFAALRSGTLDLPAAAGLMTAGVPYHALLGFGGWLSFTAFGVSYRLLSMFMMAPEIERRTTRAALIGGAAALALAAAALAALGLDRGDGGLLLAAVSALAFATALYGADVVTLYRVRRRRQLEINMQASIVAFAMLALSAVALPVALAAGVPASLLIAPVFLFAFGWLSGLTLAQLVKIVSFMTWLETYSRSLGHIRPPRVGELLAEHRARIWFALYFGGVALGTVALVAGPDPAFRIAALLCLAGTAGIACELIRVRRLAEIDPARRPPDGRRPRLFLPRSDERRPIHGAVPAHPRA